MLAEKYMEEITVPETRQNTCEYKGVTYFVATDMKTKKCFIEVDGKRKYLDCNGRVANKEKGTKSVKTAIENFEDARKIQNYFLENEQWNYYLLFTLGSNTGRRVGDILATRWYDFFFANGNMRTFWDVKKYDQDGNLISGEQKTGKEKEVFINIAIQEAFKLFLEKEKSIDFKYDYEEPVFKQLHGTHRGRVLSREAYRLALDKASDACLDYKVRSHSMRRGMGKQLLELHPNDPKAKSILMSMYNHSSEAMTNKYIGETAKNERRYLEDLGEKYKRYVMDGEEIPFAIKKPVASYDTSMLRNYMLECFVRIFDIKDESDPVVLMKFYNELLDGLENIVIE